MITAGQIYTHYEDGTKKPQTTSLPLLGELFRTRMNWISMRFQKLKGWLPGVFDVINQIGIQCSIYWVSPHTESCAKHSRR